MTSLRIGQITDLHARQAQPGTSLIPKRRSRETLALLPAALRDLKDRGAQFVAITGDLLDVPDYITRGDDYYDYHPATWRQEAESDYRACKTILDACGLPYMVLPGNHDLEAAMWSVFDRESHTADVAGWRIARFCDREGDCHMPRRLDRERKLMQALLGGTDTRPQIHLQHYVITPELNQGYPHSYLENASLREQLESSGRVALALSGHYHAGTELLGTKTRFTTCPAFCDFPHPYRLYELDAGGVTVETLHALKTHRRQGRPTAFVDRDGVITRMASYSTGPHDITLVPGAARGIRKLHEAGYAVAVITAQSAVAYGYVTPMIVGACNDHMCRLLRDEAGELAQPDAVFFSCGGHPAVHAQFADESDCKPSPVLLHRAVELLGTTLEKSFMIGDRDSDIETAHNAKVTPIVVRTGDGLLTEAKAKQKNLSVGTIADDLGAAADWITANFGF
jgi:histidinol-phosphate phosphatase family protein